MGINKKPFIFERPLIEGVIRKRRNRFIMEVDIDDTVYDCHCPATGRIGNIVFRNIPCLLSQSNDTKRKTSYTVEAISLDLPSEDNKSWIGINQNAVNRYVEHFLKTGQLSAMVENGNNVMREQKLGNSKLDFLVGNTYLEVKTPLTELQVEIKDHIATMKMGDFNSFERFVKHISELAESLKQNQRAILLNCFIYKNPGYKVPAKHKHSDYVREVVQSCIERGIEIWQINFKITPKEVNLINYFETTNDFKGGGTALN
ncbi:sugar fermentation stimulation protein [Lucifera butyrica]|uniref:Sugar fermentation stimulation protein n=1 Tax=Lucifera butyrica TaxID=1351585 RepID=A0A498R929_9FIRM|nr:DNA/RNA nuclease SfsA [Lucifera butyrica]VBB09216.1 sugar fermentation stimulation protein [Lucifera butyrica]